MPPELAEDGRAALERVFGALHPKVRFVDGTAVALLNPEPEHRGNPGWLHGGMAATVLDHVCARAAAAVLEAPVVTATLDLRYRQPVALDGGPFEVTAEVTQSRRGLARVSGAIRDRSGRPFVEARALFSRRPGE